VEQCIMLIVIVVVFGGMMWWQSKKAKQQQQEKQDFRRNLQPGTEVITIGQVIGKVVEVDEQYEEIVIDDNDATALAKAPGLGKKGAQKIILELKGSIDLSQIEGASAQAATSKSPVDTGTEQVVEGLISLGWRQQDAQQAVAEACAENDIPTPLATDDVPRVLRLALALMDRGR
jgi:preprotein translocase YajC subunit